MSKNKASGVVFSTNPDFQFQYDSLVEKQTLSPSSQDLRILRDSKKRGGKTVTLIRGFVGSLEDLEQLGKKLKTHCGVGGTCKDGEVILQGDVREKVCAYLEKESYRFKRAGG